MCFFNFIEASICLVINQVDSLEKELKEAKRKHAQLLSVVEAKRKQKNAK